MTANVHRDPPPKCQPAPQRPVPWFLRELPPHQRRQAALDLRRAEERLDTALREILAAARLRVPGHGPEIVALGALAVELFRRLAADVAAAGDLEADPGGHDR